MEIKVAKFQLYPEENPQGYAVGFNIKTINNRTLYRDTVVSLENATNKIDEEILELAWEDLKEGILSEVERLEAINPVIGDKWNPSNLEQDMISIIEKRDARDVKLKPDPNDEDEDGEFDIKEPEEDETKYNNKKVGDI